MAFTVKWQFIASDRFTPVQRKIEAANRRVDSSFKRVNKTLERQRALINRNNAAFSKFLKGPIANLATGFLGIAAAAKVMQVGLRFETALADLSAITGATGRDLQFLKEQSINTGLAYGMTGDKVLEATKLIASAKPELLENKAALAAITKETLLLSKAAGTSLSDAATTIGVSLNQFGQGAEQANRFVNVLAAGAKFGSSEIEQTASALLKAGPAAAAAGVSFEKTNALIQGLAAGGLKGEIAGTGLNAIFIRMQKLGVDLGKSGLTDTFTMLGEKLNNIPDVAERAKVMTEAFGQENIKTVETLIKQAAILDTLERKVTGTNVAQEQAAARMATTNFKWDKFIATIQAKLIPLFERMQPMTGAMIDSWTRMAATLTKQDMEGFADGLKVILGILNLIAKAIGGIIIGVGKVFGTANRIGSFLGGFAADIMEPDLGMGGGRGGNGRGRTAANAAPTAAAAVAQSSKTEVEVTFKGNAPVDQVRSKQRGRGSRVAISDQTGTNMGTGQ